MQNPSIRLQSDPPFGVGSSVGRAVYVCRGPSRIIPGRSTDTIEGKLRAGMSTEVDAVLNATRESDDDIDISGIKLEDILKEEDDGASNEEREALDEQKLLEELLLASSFQRSHRSKSRDRSRGRSKSKHKGNHDK